MLGLIEFSLFMIPVAVYAIWRFTSAAGGPSPRSLIAGAIAVAVLASFLFWYSRENRMDPNAVYIPPHVEDGRLIPGHAVQK